MKVEVKLILVIYDFYRRLIGRRLYIQPSQISGLVIAINSTTFELSARVCPRDHDTEPTGFRASEGNSLTRTSRRR